MSHHPVEAAAATLVGAVGACTALERAWLRRWLQATADKFAEGMPHGHVADVWHALADLVESYEVVEQHLAAVEDIFRPDQPEPS